MAQKYFNEVTDPTQFLRPLPRGTQTGYHERPKTIDQALANVTDVLDGNGAKIGTCQPDYDIMLNSHLRDLIDTWKRVPTREECLADMLISAHPDWDIQQLFAMGCKDGKSNQVGLKAALQAQRGGRAGQLVRAATPLPQRAAAPLQKAIPLAQAMQTAQAVQVPSPRKQTVVSASTAATTFKFPATDWLVEGGILVLVQDSDSPYLWTPSDTVEVFGFAIGDTCLSATWSGISYTLGGSNHLIMILEQ